MEDDCQLEHQNYLYQPQSLDSQEMEHEELPQQVHEQPHVKEWHMVETGDHHGREARELLAQDIQQDALQAYEFHLVDQEVYKILQLQKIVVIQSKLKYQKPP